MDLTASSQTYRAALQERKEKEMEEVEEWIDQTQVELYKSLSQDGRRRSSVILSEECRQKIDLIMKDYEEKGFKKEQYPLKRLPPRLRLMVWVNILRKRKNS